MYALFGTSRQLAVGPVAMVSLLVAAAVAPLADGNTELYVGLALLLSLMVAVFGLIDVENKSPVENGLRLRVRPTKKAARASLDRVLEAHPMMLKQETGWTMEVEKTDGAYVLRVTSSDTGEPEKIRALGYMGLIAYGSHHQRHHWHLVQGADPHSHDAE